MLSFLGRAKKLCDGITRRELLRVGGLAFAGLTLADLLRLRAAASPDAGRGKSVIMIWLRGGASHIDSYDMKPDAPAEVRGPFKPIRTNSPDIQISEIFPKMAKHADKFSLVRTCYHTAAAVHDTGHQMMQTGRLFAGGLNTPHAGCVLGYLRGGKNDLPSHVILPEPMGRTRSQG